MHLIADFEMFDTNGDGTLTLDEIQKIFKRGDEPMTDEEVEKATAMFAKYDKNGDGVLDIEEFAEMYAQGDFDEFDDAKKGAVEKPKPLKEDGTLDDKPYTMEELKAQGKTKKQLKKVAKDRLKRFLTCVDYNSNGVVDMPEILALFGYFEKEKRDAGDEESAKRQRVRHVALDGMQGQGQRPSNREGAQEVGRDDAQVLHLGRRQGAEQR